MLPTNKIYKNLMLLLYRFKENSYYGFFLGYGNDKFSVNTAKNEFL